MGAYSMTERKLLTLDDFVKQPTTYTRFGEKVTRNPIEQVYNAGLLKDYKQLSVSHKYIRFTGMREEADGGEGWYIRDDNITDEEDIGVIIYIGQYKYRRLYGAYVLVDWFYTGDFGIALQRACKYASVRCIAGKVYECNSEITLKLDVRGISGKHGMVDYGHVLIDLRGATINYNVENSSFCFNIRIYNRETKFMLTNGTFNVSEASKVYLKNIANIIGNNNYTDMLTDMHYNVDKALLPDTNRVVLFSDPTIEGVKTFSTSFNYVGDNISAEDNQAVTKDYIPVGINENSYIAIGDTRKLANVVFSSNFIIGGNVATENNVEVVINKVYEILANVAKNVTNNIFTPGMYYTALDSDYLYLPYPKIEYIKEPDYTVNLLLSAEYIFMPSALEFDEQFIGVPIYNEVRCNKRLVVPKSSLVEEICESTRTIVEESKILSSILPPSKYSGYPLLFRGSAVNYHIFDSTIIENKTIQLIGRSEYNTQQFIFTTTDGNNYIYDNLQPAIGYTYMHYESGDKWVVNIDTKAIHTMGMLYKEYANLYASNKLLIPLLNGNTLVAIIEIINPARDSFYSEGGLRSGYLLTRSNTYIFDAQVNNLGKYTITGNYLVTKVADNISVTANIIAGSEYISARDNIEIYVKDYTEEENDTISFNIFYVKAFVPVQANLQVFTGINDIVPTSRYILVLKYNKEVYTSSAGAIYIPRFKIDYPYYQSKTIAAVSKKAITAYNDSILFTNPLLNSLIYSREYITRFNFNTKIIPTTGTHINRAQDEHSGSGCQCYHRDTTIQAKFMGTFLYTNVYANGSSVYCNSAQSENIPLEYITYTDYTQLSPLTINYGGSVANYDLKLYSVNAVYCSNLSNIKYEDVAIRSYYLQSTKPKCSKCSHGGSCPPTISGSGVPACWFYCVALYSSKIRMFDYIFGKDAWARWVYRDGNLKNPYKDRSSRPEYARIAPVYPYKE